MKKLIFLTVVVLSVLFIYLGFKDKDVYYLSVGDGISLGVNNYKNIDYAYSDYIKEYLLKEKKLEKYVNYSNLNMHTTDLIKDINSNIKIKVSDKEKNIQNVLIKSDLITLSIGNNDFLNNLKISHEFSLNDIYTTFNESLVDMEELFTLMRKYCKEEIFLIGFYDYTNNPELLDFIKYVNNKMDEITKRYNINYIDVTNIVKIDDNNRYPTKEGYRIISEEIIKKIHFNK